MKSLIIKALACLNKEQKTVLDIGTGKGGLALNLARAGYIVTALDKERDNILKLCDFSTFNKLNINCINGDINKFQFKKYDMIISLNVLHFLTESEIKSVIKKMQENTNDDGINVISAFTEKNPNKKFSYLFKLKELSNLYKDWKIEYYDEHMTDFEQHNNFGWHQHGVVEMVARKINV